MKFNLKTFLLRMLRSVCSDKQYIQIRYLAKYKRFLNLKEPNTFNAKINWLKLYDRDPLYHKLVDKYEVREYVINKIGEEYLNDLIGIYDKVEDINFDQLPYSFVLKATHGSSWVIVCKDKSQLDISSAKLQMEGWLHNNFYKMWGEWVYKNVPPRIICEKFLLNENESSLIDYKFYCFHGQPEFIHVDMDRIENHTRNFYDLNWNCLPFSLLYPQADREAKKPTQLKKMIEMAKVLSADFKFVRVDLYQIQERIVFGELTFNPGNGLEIFTPERYDFEIGTYLKI